jgi:flagellar hook assembly protein FlgD
MQPSDSNALLQQLNSIRSIESDIKLTDQLQSLVTQNQLSAASGMIGKFVGGMTADSNHVAGFVMSVIRQGNDVNLELDNGWIVPISNVETVVDPSLLPDANGSGGSASGNGSTSGTGTGTGTGATGSPPSGSASGGGASGGNGSSGG